MVTDAAITCSRRSANYLKGHFLSEPLRDWDVSRPAPYFGFEIPDSPGNYWYVWFDAPIGYIASTWEWCKRQGEKLEDWWKPPSDGEAWLRREAELRPRVLLDGLESVHCRKSTTSSARTSRTFTRCSGPAC